MNHLIIVVECKRRMGQAWFDGTRQRNLVAVVALHEALQRLFDLRCVEWNIFADINRCFPELFPYQRLSFRGNICKRTRMYYIIENEGLKFMTNKVKEQNNCAQAGFENNRNVPTTRT